MSMINGQKRLYEFGQFCVDSGERLLLRNGAVVPLPPRVFDTLLLLVRNSGRALDKDALMKELWPDTFVEEVNLAQHISLLRKALGESPTEPQYIETIPRRGYRFLAKVSEIVDARTRPDAAAAQPSRRARLSVRAPLALVFFASGFVVALLLVRARPTEISPYRFTPLVVDSSLKVFPAWSPSGKTVAYSGEVDGFFQIFTKTLGASMSTQITKQAKDCFYPFWAPDGRRVFYMAVAEGPASFNHGMFNLWSVGAVGGSAEPVMRLVSDAAISPDGKTLAIIRSEIPGGLGELLLSSPPGAEPKKYTEAPFAGRRYRSYAHLRFSPDGSKLAVSLLTMATKPEFWILPFPAGEPRRVLASLPVTAGVKQFGWMPDGRHIVFSENFVSSSNPHLFIGDTERGDIRPITVGAGGEQAASVSPDGATIAYASMEGAYDIVEVPLDGSGIRNLTSTPRNEVTPGWSPSGAVYAYATNRSGAPEIWLKSQTEGWDRPLVTQKDFGTDATSSLLDVTFSPDGHRIAYRRTGEREEAVWISTLAGDPPVRLVQEPEAAYQRGPAWSPDGAWIAYYSNHEGKFAVMKAGVGGSGPPIALGKDIGYPRWSPNGEWLACDGAGIFLISPDGKVRRTLSTERWMIHGWSKDGKKIYGIRATAQRRLILASIDIQTGTEAAVGDLGAYPAAFAYKDLVDLVPIRGYSLAPDGKSFATSIFRARGDIWLLEGFRQPVGFWHTLFRLPYS
jgi:Tol biopolymer transport system component/DNA-binding winged helix-turn-helix (wHTH) protein